MTRTWTVVPELPIGATNILVDVVGEMNAQGQMLQLNGITVTYDEPEEKPLLFDEHVPNIYQSDTGSYWIVWYRFAKGSRQFYGDTKAEAIHLANEHIRKYGGIA